MELIVSDLDGTLLNNNGIVTEKSIDILRKIKEKGYEIAIATGRSYNSAGKIRKIIDVEMYMICNNGANIYNKDGSILKTNLIPSSLGKEAIKILDEEKVNYKAFNGLDVYLPKYARIHEEIKNEHKLTFLEDFNILPDLEKVLIIEDDEKKLFRVKDLMFKHFKDNLEIVISSSDCLDLNMKNCSKKMGVKVISEKLGINSKNIMAFGDSGNDYKMLKFVGYPVAMKDSYMSTKDFKYKTYFTNDEDGVADYLERKFLK